MSLLLHQANYQGQTHRGMCCVVEKDLGLSREGGVAEGRDFDQQLGSPEFAVDKGNNKSPYSISTTTP